MIPKRGIAVVIAGIGAALLLAGASPKISQVKPIVLTYWEAKAAGFHVPPLPSETGMRVCTEDDLDNPGYRSPEAAEKALAEYEAR